MTEKEQLLVGRLERAMQHLSALKRINSELRSLPRDAEGDTALKLNVELTAITEAEIQRIHAELGVREGRFTSDPKPDSS